MWVGVWTQPFLEALLQTQEKWVIGAGGFWLQKMMNSDGWEEEEETREEGKGPSGLNFELTCFNFNFLFNVGFLRKCQ